MVVAAKHFLICDRTSIILLFIFNATQNLQCFGSVMFPCLYHLTPFLLLWYMHKQLVIIRAVFYRKTKIRCKTRLQVRSRIMSQISEEHKLVTQVRTWLSHSFKTILHFSAVRSFKILKNSLYIFVTSENRHSFRDGGGAEVPLCMLEQTLVIEGVVTTHWKKNCVPVWANKRNKSMLALATI